MASDLVELAAEVSSIRALLLLIAPMALEDGGVSPETVEQFAKEMSEEFSKFQAAGVEPEAAAGFLKANTDKLNSLFSEVAKTMRVRADARAGKTQ